MKVIPKNAMCALNLISTLLFQVDVQFIPGHISDLKSAAIMCFSSNGQALYCFV